ncbi:MAG: diacylglycerol kinase family protein [Sphingobacteriaceae bacterium]
MKKFFKGFQYAVAGLRYGIKTQLNFRIHLLMSVLAVLLGCFLEISLSEWLWILLCIALVCGAELLNTALEKLTDMVSPQWNEKAGQVKDLSAAAVLVIALFTVGVGAAIFVPKLIVCFF